MACSGASEGKDTLVQGSTTPHAASSASASATEAAPEASGPPRVLILGTSITAGLGLDPEQAYPARLQHIADSLGVRVRIVNAGLSGETSAGALRRVDWLLNDPASIVVVETGANDGLRGLDPDTTAANIRAIAAKVKARMPSARLVIAQMEAPPNFGERYTGKFRSIYPAVAKDVGAVLLPFLLDSVAGVPTLNQPDGIHPTAAGANIVARNVWRTLGPEIARLDRNADGR